MRSWWKKLGFVAGCLAAVECSHLFAPVQAQAQLPGGYPADPTFGGMCAPTPLSVGSSSLPAPYSPPVDLRAISLPNDGSPNGFADFDNCNPWNWPIIWGGAEGIYGFTPWVNRRVPLATTSTNPNTATQTGAIGQSNTIILAKRAGLDLRNPVGLAFTLGYCPTPEWKVPFEVKYLYLRQTDKAFSAQADEKGRPLLARPIQSTTPGLEGETVFQSSFPGLAQGAIGVDGSLQVWGLDVRGIIRTGLQWGDDGGGFAIDLPVGFRYLNMNDVVNISNSATPLDASFNVAFGGQSFGPGTTTIATDMFKANNEFRGGELGIRFECRHDNFSLVLDPRVCIGSTSRSVLIAGNSVIFDQNTNTSSVAPGGIMAVSTNSGRHSTGEEFTLIPEGAANLNWDVFPWMRLTLGYNVTYWPGVFRAADQVNRAVDLRQVPTSPNFTPGIENYNGPSFQIRERDFFLQSASIGIVFSY